MATRPAVRSAQATRRDLLLETLALRHQLGVLARSNKRFRPVDRLFWLFLRWLWPRWREALVLIQPPTVDRWHREGVRQCWRRRSRRPGRPRIDSTCRDLIRRIAAENCLGGRAADPWRTTEAWNHHFGAHRLALSARPPDHPVTDMADIPLKHLRQPDVCLAGDVRVCGR